MRRYLIGGIGVAMAALFLTIPTATAEARSPVGLHHGTRAHARVVRPAYRIAPRVYAPCRPYRPAHVVPRSAHYHYWHHRQ